MKTLLTLSMLVLIVTTSIVSCNLFLKAEYDASALLTLICIVSLILSVNILSNKKVTLL
jgi:hypothetical protein